MLCPVISVSRALYDAIAVKLRARAGLLALLIRSFDAWTMSADHVYRDHLTFEIGPGITRGPMSRAAPTWRSPSFVFPSITRDSTDSSSDAPSSLPFLQPSSSKSSQPALVLSSGQSGLSDDFIRPVVPREGRESRHSYLESGPDTSARAWKMERIQSNGWYTYSRKDRASNQSSGRRSRSLGLGPRSSQSPKRTSLALTKRIKSERRRQQCRTNQARYRERQKAKLWVKEEDNACLREVISLLEVQRSLMRAVKTPRTSFAQHVVVEFYNRFRTGLSGACWSKSDLGDSKMLDSYGHVSLRWIGQGRAENNATLLKQIAFMRTVVHPDAEVGNGLRGPDALLEQLWRHSVLFKNLRLELQTIELVMGSDSHSHSVLAVGQVRATMTQRTLDIVLPGLSTHLRQQLLGRTLVFSKRLCIEFEEAFDGPLLQVTRLNMVIESAGVFSEALRHPLDIEQALTCAQISPHGFIGNLTNHPGSYNDEM